MPHNQVLGSVRSSLVSLQTNGDTLKKKMIEEKQKVAKLEGQLKELQETVAQYRENNKVKAIELMNVNNLSSTNRMFSQKVDGNNPTRVAEINQKRLIENLEGRLNKALVRRSTIEAENNTIKANIDKFRYQIQNDRMNQQSMTKQVNAIQEDIDHVLKKTAALIEQRDKIIEQNNQIVHDDMEEKQLFGNEYHALGQFISEQKTILENSISSMTSNMLTKLRSIDNSKSAPVHGSKVPGMPNSSSAKENPADEMKHLDERLAYLDQRIETYKQMIRHDGNSHTLEKTLKELEQAFGLSNKEDVVNVFLRNDEECYSLFNYIQSVNEEHAKVLEQRAALENEVEVYLQGQRLKEEECKAQVDEYKRQLRIVEDEGRKYMELVREGKTTIVQIANKVQALYLKLRCSELEGENGKTEDDSKKIFRNKSLRMDRKMTMFSGEEISERNILHRMELIEKRSIQVIAEYSNRMTRNKNRQRRLSMILVSNCDMRINRRLSFIVSSPKHDGLNFYLKK